MPHLRLEYSANLEEKADMAAICAVAYGAIMASGIFEIGAPRVRAYPAPHYAIADRHPDNAFLDMVFRLGAGRGADDKKRVGDAIMAAVAAELAPLLAAPHFALSLEVVEIDPDLSWKKNSMHARLRGK
ncbi:MULTISPECIES: 5-carboxymethyl-2-hydroxymuconate Delta-isomerase [Alphaproteobacteria]|uniref:5-carboxymethyl-2-hydroxymuconate isomerase n=2 Tax=Alphaproteobacteria TaxID=28211 RepID=A0A512HJP0_9HYPH|nr:MULTISPECIES: 5-carboxymethyl-2-hydroxymuconate Delta-isomerase [Alphaproteobacteria]GEO85662.1 5-carboxymethyl-2-hydroxymuconate isomerase [Ciceribacter naphthalenivorans]GLR21983.1 5-carboxymethyl-2-hydroxymuconate isomerase [Ciceribacter naphthalenivorans]GLT04839.1 5-carboxymethyl-2-hydroxymuconate isomerase [Sphingomonas psychrolutea]